MTAVAMAMFAATQKEAISLAGSSGSPILCIDLQTTPDDAFAYIDFATGGGIAATGYSPPSTDWCNKPPSVTYYIKATEISTAGGGTRTGTLNTALALTSLRRWSVLNTSNLLSNAEWVLKFDIADDSGMTNILATGYYKLRASVSD